jgi:hypothetical protein
MSWGGREEGLVAAVLRRVRRRVISRGVRSVRKGASPASRDGESQCSEQFDGDRQRDRMSPWIYKTGRSSSHSVPSVEGCPSASFGSLTSLCLGRLSVI